MKIWNATIHTMTDAGILENGYVLSLIHISEPTRRA